MEREAGCEGREEDPKVEVHRVTRSPLFLFVCLFAKKRDHVLNVPGVEAVERWDVPEKGEGRSAEPVGALALCRVRREGGWVRMQVSL